MCKMFHWNGTRSNIDYSDCNLPKDAEVQPPHRCRYGQRFCSDAKCSERRGIEKKTKQMVHVENYSISHT